VRNTFLIFLVSGFWHGANWTFVAWGFLHACAFIPLLLTNKNRKHVNEVVAQDKFLPEMRELVQMMTTFVFVTLAWIFFRAESIGDAINYLQSSFTNGLKGQPLQNAWKVPLLSSLLLIVDWYLRKDERNLKVPGETFLRYTIYLAIGVAVIYHLLMAGQSTFIYFQF
jgi:D-alanyl-lipoteichoic acid acyltransferase DltB (MBOAT superfamily)